jgi:hypothetical protein
MVWDDPETKWLLKALPGFCGMLVLGAFCFSAWLFRHRPQSPVSSEGFTNYLFFSGGRGMYVRSEEEAVFYWLLIVGATSALLTAWMYRGLYGRAPHDHWVFLASVAVGVALAAGLWAIANI